MELNWGAVTPASPREHARNPPGRTGDARHPRRARDLCFQNFEQELAQLPGEYAAPRGALLLAKIDGDVAGCCALRPLDSVDYPNAAEMKRLYVRKPFRNFGLGRELAEAALDAAREAGYACVLLDTLDDMEAARELYEELGFEEIPPYYHNPIAGAHYLKVELG
jgi:putative acetyltransferase